jgi:hypothetical protein
MSFRIRFRSMGSVAFIPATPRKRWKTPAQGLFGLRIAGSPICTPYVLLNIMQSIFRPAARETRFVRRKFTAAPVG